MFDRLFLGFIKWIAKHEKLSAVALGVSSWLSLAVLVRFMCDMDAYSVLLLFVWFALFMVFPISFTISFSRFYVSHLKEEYR